MSAHTDPYKADQQAINTLRLALAFWEESLYDADQLTQPKERRIEQAKAWLVDQESSL